MKTVPLRHLAELNPQVPEFDVLPDDAEVNFLPLETVWSDSRADHTRVAIKSAVKNGYNRFAPGDILVPKVTPTFQAARTMQAKHVGAGTTELHVLRAKDDNDPRWIAYATRSAHFLREGVTAFQGVAGLQRVPADFVASFKVAATTPDEQRRIADFLDDRVARIDQIIVARRQQGALAEEAMTTSWAQASRGLEKAYTVVPMRRFLHSIADGPFGSSLTSSHYTDGGTRVFRLGNIGIARFKDVDKAYIAEDYAKTLSQHAVHPGDLLMAGLGDSTWPLGRCAVAPEHLGPAIVKADCYRIRLDVSIDHAFAAGFLSNSTARGRAQLLSRGATRARLNTDVARESLIPVAPIREQLAYVHELSRWQNELDGAQLVLQRSIELLTEFKSSLITAAVTGELDVTTASRRIPGE